MIHIFFFHLVYLLLRTKSGGLEIVDEFLWWLLQVFGLSYSQYQQLGALIISQILAIAKHCASFQSIQDNSRETQCDEHIEIQPDLCSFFGGGRGHAYSIRKLLGQVLSLCHSSDLSCYSDKARSLTHCTTRELLDFFVFLKFIYLFIYLFIYF